LPRFPNKIRKELVCPLIPINIKENHDYRGKEKKYMIKKPHRHSNCVKEENLGTHTIL